MDDEGRERFIAYGSRLLTKPERKYCVTRREILAVVTFVQQYRPYLICRKFTLRTDHGSVTWLRNFKEPEGQLARWLERLQELDFEIVHRRGSAHRNADSLSRLPCRQCGRASHGTTSEIAATALQGPLVKPSDSLHEQQLADQSLGPIIWGRETSNKPGARSFEAATQVHADCYKSGISWFCIKACCIGSAIVLTVPEGSRLWCQTVCGRRCSQTCTRGLSVAIWAQTRPWGALKSTFTGQDTTRT